MGFIERLQRQIQTQRKQEEQNRKRGKHEAIRNLESTGSQEEKSKKYYEESGCGLLVNKLSEIIGGRILVYEGKWEWGHPTQTEDIIEEFKFNLRRNDRARVQLGTDRLFGYIKYKENGLGSHVIFITWEGNKRESGDWTQNCIAIEACPSGEIYFHGGWGGSSVVERIQWQEDKEHVERVLEKAYHHPKQKLHAYRPPESPGFGGVGM
jgi:hypothetical protein